MDRAVKALVLGGSGAVGKKIVDNLLARGIKVVASSRKGDGVNNRAIALKWDASDELMLPKCLTEEGVSLSVFFCIGVPSSKETVKETSIGQFQRLFDVNALGLVRAYQAIKDCNFERVNIVAVSSDATVGAREKNGPYSASKTALEVVARTIACEEHEGDFRINVVAPSLIDSPMARQINTLIGNHDFNVVTKNLPLGRAITPEEVALAAVDIAIAKQWSYSNGQVFRLSSPPR